MKIAFLFNRIRLSLGDGIVSQALTWKRILEDRGHQVDLADGWHFLDYAQYDIVQMFGKPINLLYDIRGVQMKTKEYTIAYKCIYYCSFKISIIQVENLWKRLFT